MAAASLELLLQDFDIEAVITKPKPPHHKGAFPVLDVAEQHKLRLHTVANKQELSALMATNPCSSQVGVLIDFGILVSQDVIDYFPRGIVNSHFSLLPEWRGADPITYAVLSGQKSTGVSLMLLVAAMDEGPLVAYGEYQLPQDITTPVLTEHLIHLSHKLLKAELPKYLSKPDFVAAPQTITGRAVSYSRKLTKQDGTIDWHKPADVLEREVRAYLEWPTSRTRLAGKDVAITKASVVKHSGEPGTVDIDTGHLIVHCGQDALQILSLKPAGKKEMTAEAFLNGHKQLLQSS